jgi:transposase
MPVVKPYRRLTDPFVQDAVALMQRTDRSFDEIADGLGVTSFTLRRWYNELVTKKKKRQASSKRREVPAIIAEAETPEAKSARLERENAVLRKRINDLEIDRDILKKAAAFFAKESE